MALTDIIFEQSRKQNFILEIPLDILHSPIDIVFEAESPQYLVMELRLSGGGNIFIMSE